MKNPFNNQEIQEIKDALEDEARSSEIKVHGKTATLKSQEQKEAEREIEAWKKEKKDYVPIKEFQIPHELIKVILTTNQYNGLIFFGEGGIGKTVLTISSIKTTLEPEEWSYSNGYSTPLALYEFLYNNRSKKVIILDDLEGVFNNRLSQSILKGALWDSDGKRIVQYSSKSPKASMPQKFVMNAKIIILCNKIPKENDVSTRAMITRTIPFEIKFSFLEKMRICKNFIAEDKEIGEDTKVSVLKVLEENVTEATKDFNFRTLKKLIAFVQYDEGKAEKLFKATTTIDELRFAVLEAIAQTKVVKAQVELFIEWTGRSRRTFFSVKKKLGAKVQSDKHTALKRFREVKQ